MAQTEYSTISLIQGIETMISKNRSSFSDDEINLLQECLQTLQEHKKSEDKKNLSEVVFKVLSVFAKPEVISLINDWINHFSNK